MLAQSMSRIVALLVLFALTALLLTTTPAKAQEPAKDEQALVADVNRSIERGVQYLRSIRKKDTHWEEFWLNQVGGMRGGVTALACLAMLNCGVPPDDKDLAPALDYIRGVTPTKTYPAAMIVLALAEARQPKDLRKIQENIDWLLKTAIRKEKLLGWSYPDPDLRRADASNTQYALLALYAGKQAGAVIPEEIWKEIRQLYIEDMIDTGKDQAYWTYVRGRPDPSFTMTVAGVSGLVISLMASSESTQQLDPATGVAARCGEYLATDKNGKPVNISQVIRRGLNWTGEKFAFDNAPGSMSTYYNVYGIERVGRLSGERFIGKIDWYRQGCEWLLKEQNKTEGSWQKANVENSSHGIDRVSVIATSFALLFLSKGRTPILISKLAFGDHVIRNGVLSEKSEVGITGWNRKRNDARNVTDFASREVFKGLPLGWQVYDPRRRSFENRAELLDEVGVLVQSPILYLTGHEAPMMSGQQKQLLKMYIEEGGFVVAEACCGSKAFADGFRQIMKDLFPENELKLVAPEHAIWQSHFAVPPSQFNKLESLERGCRTVVVFSPEPLAGFWEEARFMPPRGAKAATNSGEEAFRLSANIIAYATGKEPPKQRLSQRRIADASQDQKVPPRGFIKPVQIRLDETAPAPAAMRNLMAYLRDIARIDVVLDREALPPDHMDLFNFKFLYMHGKKSFKLDDASINNIKANLQPQAGGLLLADACCGSAEFDKSFREFIAKAFPDSKLQLIPTTDPLYSERLNGVEIKTVKRRLKPSGADKDAGYEELPPALEGIKIDGRWVVIYSKYDLGCALEGHKSSDCLGHTPESAKRLAAAAVLYSLKRLGKE